jgi:hypothetical protein
MADRQPPDNVVPQVPSDGGHLLHSNKSTQPATPPVSHLETTTSMPDESVIPCPTTLSDSIPETPRNADDYQPAIVSDVHDGAPSHDPAKYSVAPMDSGSDDSDHIHTTDSIHECGSPFVVLSAPSDPSPCPLHVPLPESDEEDSETTRDEGVSGTEDGKSQHSDAYTSSTDGRTSPLSDPDSPNVVQPSKHSRVETSSCAHAF